MNRIAIALTIVCSSFISCCAGETIPAQVGVNNKAVITVRGEMIEPIQLVWSQDLTVSKVLAITGTSSFAVIARIFRDDVIIPVSLLSLGKDGYNPILQPGDILELLYGCKTR